MRAFAKTVLFASLLGGFILLACDSSTSSGTTTSVPGTWKGKALDSTLTMVFLDTSFTGSLHNQAGLWEMSGTYKVTGSTIRLKYASSLEDGIGAPPPSPDSVVATLAGKQMKIPVPYDYTGNDSVTLTKQ